MKTITIIRMAVAGVLGVGVVAQAQQVGGEEQRVMAELSRRQMGTLLEYSFKKYNVSEKQQKIYRAESSLKQLSEGTASLSRKQQQELVGAIVEGIDEILKMTSEPKKLMELNSLLVKTGMVTPLNTLEYWGENPRTQGQLRPIATAVDKLYEKAVAEAQKKADELSNSFKGPDDPKVKEWEELMQLAGMARFNSAFNKYAVALSMDRADARRAEAAKAGLEILKEYQDPQYEVQAQARSGMGKLNLAMGSKESLAAAKGLFKQVKEDAGAAWNLKFEAVYFTAVADLVGKDLAGARKGVEEVGKWLKENPPAGDEVKKGTEAAVAMLEFRILDAEREAASGEAAKKANEKAVAALQALMKKRPDLAGVINEQLMARLPENAALKELDTLLLKAMVARGDEEIRKGENQPVDKKALGQALAASAEIVGRVGKGTATVEDAESCELLVGFFHARLGHDAEAAKAFLDYVGKHRKDRGRMDVAMDNAAAAVAKLKKERPGDAATEEAYLRLLQVATGEPFKRMEFAFEYGRALLDRNMGLMQGNVGDGQRKQMVEWAKKAGEMFRATTDEKRVLHARYFEMLAYNQAIELLPENSGEINQFVKKTQDLAGEVNKILDAQMPGATDEAAKGKLRWFRVRTSLLAADLAKHDRSAERNKSLEKALTLLANFEKDVEGLANANNLLGEALFIRVNALMSLKRSDEALANLGKFLETRSGDDGIRIVYEMLESLNKEFQQAEQNKNQARMAELAGHRAKVSGYLVDRVNRSTNPEVKKLAPKYRMFEAGALQQAAVLEKDEAKRAGYLKQAMGIFEEARKASPEDKGIQLNIALVKYDLGDYAGAQPVLVKFLAEGWLGKPKVAVSGPEGERMIDNNQYWDAMYRLLRCNVALANAQAAGYEPGKLMEETKLKLKQLYIQWGTPGGARWGEKFEVLRKEIMPEWEAPKL